MSQAHQATGLELHGITNVARVYWNLSVPSLYEEAVQAAGGDHLGGRSAGVPDGAAHRPIP